MKRGASAKAEQQRCYAAFNQMYKRDEAAGHPHLQESRFVGRARTRDAQGFDPGAYIGSLAHHLLLALRRIPGAVELMPQEDRAALLEELRKRKRQRAP